MDRSIPKSVAVWGSAAIEGPRLLRQISGRLTPGQYLSYLRTLSQEAENGSAEAGFPFAHDHCNVHRSAAVRQWMASQSTLLEVPWPVSGGDIMTLSSSIWSAFNFELNLRSAIPTNSVELWNEIRDLWETFSSTDYNFNLPISAIPFKLRAILDQAPE